MNPKLSIYILSLLSFKSIFLIFIEYIKDKICFKSIGPSKKTSVHNALCLELPNEK